MNINSIPYDQHWYVDTDATHHMTADASNMTTHANYNGTDQILVGNGTSASIYGIGNMTLQTAKTAKTPLHLKNMLHVPSIHKKLLSDAKLTKDSDCIFLFDRFGFFIKD